MVGWHHQLNGHKFDHIWETAKDKEAWRAAVHEVAKNQTWLSDGATTTNGCSNFQAHSWRWILTFLLNVLPIGLKKTLVPLIVCLIIMLSKVLDAIGLFFFDEGPVNTFQSPFSRQSLAFFLFFSKTPLYFRLTVHKISLIFQTFAKAWTTCFQNSAGLLCFSL